MIVRGITKNLACLLPALAIAAAPAQASESRIPVFGPRTITEGGYYILTRAVAASGGTAITISATGVTLDLNGFTISGPSGSTLIGIAGPTDAVVRIRNGFLYGGSNAIASATTGLSLTIERITASDFDNIGIDLGNAANLELLSSEIRGTSAAANAVSVVAPRGGTVTGRIEKNTIFSPNTSLFIAQPRSWVIKDNIFRDGAGVELADFGSTIAAMGGNLVQDNTFSGSGGGIHVSSLVPGNQILGNAIRQDAYGILLASADNRVSGNLITYSVGGVAPGALWVQGPRNLIERNLIKETSSGCGIAFTGAAATEKSYRLNMLRGNSGGPVCISGGATATDAGGNII